MDAAQGEKARAGRRPDRRAREDETQGEEESSQTKPNREKTAHEKA